MDMYCMKEEYAANKIRGFTLIEVMSVVAIIGILASIAIVMIGNQRTKAFNASALSVVNEVMKKNALLFSDHSKYGTTRIKTTQKGRRVGVAVTGGETGGSLNTPNNSRKNPEYATISLSEGVTVVVAADSTFQSFVVTAKHLSGDRRFCYDSEGDGIKYDTRFAPGKALTRGRAFRSKLNSDDCQGGQLKPL